MDILFLRLVLQVKFTISRACWLQGILGKLCRQWQNGHNRHLNPKGSVKYKFTRLQHIISKGHRRANFVEKKFSDLKPNSQSSKHHCEKKQLLIPFTSLVRKDQPINNLLIAAQIRAYFLIKWRAMIFLTKSFTRQFFINSKRIALYYPDFATLFQAIFYYFDYKCVIIHSIPKWILQD